MLLPASVRVLGRALAALTLVIACLRAGPAVSAAPASDTTAPAQPAQPTSGPGGRDYPHAEVTVLEGGSGADAYWIYLPAAPRPATAPVAIFTHGWGGMEPVHYEAWLRHLARRGMIVLYPRYQANLRTPAKEFTPNAVTAIRAALERLQAGDSPMKPDLSRVITLGHSAGGVLAANLAVALPAAGLPRPKAILCVEPGGTHRGEKALIPLLDLTQIPADTLLITVVGDRDFLVGDADAKRIFSGATTIPAANKDFVTLVSDDHGEPELIASHMAPSSPLEEVKSNPRGLRLRRRLVQRALGQGDATTPTDEQLAAEGTRSVDALDYYGTWKLADALIDAAFYGKNRDTALGGGPAQTFMGTWSDGTPVKPLRSTKTP